MAENYVKSYKRRGYGFLFQKIIEDGRYDRFLEFAVWIWVTRRWSLFNSALIFLQRTGCVWLLPEEKWKDMGRTIKSSATPIVIMVPFGPVAFVYDLADTEGNRVPHQFQSFTDFIEPPPQPVGEEVLRSLKNLCASLGIVYSERQMGAAQAGEVKRLLQAKIFREGNALKNEKPKIGWFEIIINQNCNTTQKAIAVLHELGHIFCGHFSMDKEKKKMLSFNFPDRSYEKLDEGRREWEAEKVCEIVCRILGLQYDSSKYLSGYQCAFSGEARDGSLRITLDAADKLIRPIDRLMGRSGPGE